MSNPLWEHTDYSDDRVFLVVRAGANEAAQPLALVTESVEPVYLDREAAVRLRDALDTWIWETDPDNPGDTAPPAPEPVGDRAVHVVPEAWQAMAEDIRRMRVMAEDAMRRLELDAVRNEASRERYAEPATEPYPQETGCNATHNGRRCRRSYPHNGELHEFAATPLCGICGHVGHGTDTCGVATGFRNCQCQGRGEDQVR